MPKKGTSKKAITTVYLEPEQAGNLKQLSELTRVPQAEYLREAVSDLLKKYAKELRKAAKHQ